jgi:DNA-binding PadR family transcriptional regulator
MDREKAKLKDSILTVLIQGEMSCEDISSRINSDFETIWTLSSDLYNDGYLSQRDASSKSGKSKYLTLTPEGKYFLKTSSYSSLFLEQQKSQNKEQIKKNTYRAISNIYKLATICLGVISAIFTYTKFFVDDIKIDSQKTEIEKINHINDSLILQNDKYRNHLQRKETQDTSLRN